MVAKDIRWIRLLDPENHNISWANHISQTNPGKRDKSDPSFKRQWSRLFHCAALVAYANTHGITSVRALASVTSPYFRVLNTIRWGEAGITDALLLAPETQPGGTRKSPTSLGEALTALRNRDLRAGWESSYGLHLDIYYG